MRVVIQDVETLRALRPFDVATYLRNQGWILSETVDNKFSRYTHGGSDGRYDVEVPLRTEFRDFHLRMGEVLTSLSRAESRSQLEILHDLMVVSEDVVRLRLMGSDLDNGSVPLEDGARLVERARDMLLASACAAVNPRPYFGTRKPAGATEFVKKLRMGQTEKGSFTVTLLSSVPPLLAMGQSGALCPDNLQAPFERRAVEMLMTASAAIQRATVEAGLTGDITPFENAVAEGGSANLCEALSSLLVDRRDSALELSVSWAKNRPPPPRPMLPVRLNGETAPLLVSAAAELRARAPQDDFELEGYVVRLDSDNKEAGGTITVAAEVDGKTRRVRLPLGANDYELAIKAHASTSRVSCAGCLGKQGRQYELQAVRAFSLLGDE